jgi:hypothetical protein
MQNARTFRKVTGVWANSRTLPQGYGHLRWKSTARVRGSPRSHGVRRRCPRPLDKCRFSTWAEQPGVKTAAACGVVSRAPTGTGCPAGSSFAAYRIVSSRKVMVSVRVGERFPIDATAKAELFDYCPDCLQYGSASELVLVIRLKTVAQTDCRRTAGPPVARGHPHLNHRVTETG